MDSTSLLAGVKPGFVRVAWNCRPSLSGGIEKRGGYSTQLTSAWGSNKVRAGIQFQVSGTDRVVLFGTDDTATGGTLGYVNAGAVTSITTGLSGTARPGFAQLGGLLFFYNGSDAPVLYDGSGTRQVGITEPSAAPSIVIAGGGSPGLSAGSYLWAYTYYNSTTGAESSPSALSASTAAAAGDKATLTVLAGSATTADRINIYRTFANGLELYYAGYAAIGATSYVDQIADYSLGNALELDNSRITDFDAAPEFPVVAGSRIFVITDNNEGRFSKFGQSGPMPESFQAQAFYTTQGTHGDADKVTGQAKAGDAVIVLKERSVGALVQRGIQDFTSASDPVAYDFLELSQDIGSVGVAAEVYGECVFLSRDNVYGTRGQPGDVRPLAPTMVATIKAMGFSSSQRKKLSAANNTRYKYVAFSCFSTTGGSEPDWVLVGDYQQYPTFRWTLYVPGTNTSTHPGIKAGCLFTLKASTGAEELYFGNRVGNGQYYQMESGETDDTSGIYFQVTSRPYFGASPLQLTLWKRALLYVAGDGSNYNLNANVVYDLSDEEETARSLSLFAGGAVYDVATYDNTDYVSSNIPPRRYELHRKANHAQLIFRNSGASEPITLHGWGLQGSRFKAT